MSPRHTESRVSERNLEWDSLPVLGGDPARQRFRARFWRKAIVGLVAVWAVCIWMVAG